MLFLLKATIHWVFSFSCLKPNEFNIKMERCILIYLATKLGGVSVLQGLQLCRVPAQSTCSTRSMRRMAVEAAVAGGCGSTGGGCAWLRQCAWWSPQVQCWRLVGTRMLHVVGTEQKEKMKLWHAGARRMADLTCLWAGMTRPLVSEGG